MNISINPKTGIIVISFFIMLLSLILLIHSPGVLAQDLNNTSFDSNDLLHIENDEKSLTTKFEVIDSDPEVVFHKPKQEEEPKLSNQSFEVEANITVLNVQSYPTAGGNVTQNTQASSIDRTDWDCYRAVLINNTGGSELTYYQLNVSLGDGINETSLRVVNMTVNTIIPHWCETVIDGNCTKLWFNATHIPANSWCNDTYRIYYGNDTVSSTSDYNATFTKSYNTTGLIIDLHMDEGSGLIAYDATGNHDGEFRGGMTTDDWMSYDGGFWDRRTDLVFNGSCIEFDGTYNRVDCGDGSDIPKSGSFTVCCWAKPDVAGNKWAAITDSYDSNAHVTLPIYTTNVNTFSFTTASGSWTDLHTAGFSADIWYFIAATWDVSTHTKRVYLNGLINGTQTPQPSGYPYGSCTNFTVGGRRNGDEGVAFDGWVDEVKVYNRTLSGDEVWRMYIRSKYAANAPTAALDAEENISNYIPPDPKNIQNTSGHFWVNHTWESGTGNVTNSYNVNLNGVWHNATTDNFWNDTYTAHAWQNITIYTYNTSGTGTLSSGNISQDAQIPNNPVTITNTSGWSGDAGTNVYVDYDATDADSDTPTFSCNRTDLFADFNTSTGRGNWTAASGTYVVDFGVSDGYDSTDNYTMTITVATPSTVYIPPDPTNLANTTGNNWVNYTWTADAGNITDSYNVSQNGTWDNTSSNTYRNDTISAGSYSEIIIYAYNNTNGLSSGYLSDNVSVSAIAIINSFTPNAALEIQDEQGANYKQSYPYLQKSRTLNTSATLSSTDSVGGVRFIVDQGETGETIVNDINTSDTFFSAQFFGLSYGNHTLDIIILNTSLVPLSGPDQTESIDPFWIVPYIIQFVGDSITISLADDTTCDVLNLADATGGCNAVTSENSLELPCWDNDVVVPFRDYSNGIHIFYSDYAKSIYGTYVFGNNEAESGITAGGTHTKFQNNNNGYADRFASLDENGSNAGLFGPTHAYVMLGLNDKRIGVTEDTYETQLSNVVNDIHNKGLPYENITLLYPTYWHIYDVSNYLDNIDNVANNLGTRLIKDLYNETKDNYDNGGESWYSGDNVHFTRAGSKNISRIIVEQSTWLITEQANYTEYSGSETTNFNNIPDITNVSDATLQTNTAKITWYNNVNASEANFDINVDFGFAFVNVNSTGLNNTFNSSANVTFYNLSWSETPVIFEDGSPSQNCTINFYSGGNLSFNVTHFTNYSAGANANLTIWDDTDPEGGSQTKYSQDQIKFYANYTNRTSGQPINETGVYCNISFNVTPNGPFGMTFNSSSLLYEYNRSFPTSGTFNWNVTGNGSVQDYEELYVTDIVTISTSNNYIPPDPTNLANTTGNFWVNHTWSAGSGNVTNSYNVSVNGVWHNATGDNFWNDTYTAHAWQNITVYAYNTSGTGTLSTGNVTQNTQVPSIDWTDWDYYRAVLINNTGGSELNYYQLDVSLGDGINETSLRVVNVTVNTTIPHWCETVIDGNCTKLWFNATHIPANSWCNDTYRIYYGNDTVSSTSDYNATFTKSYNTTGLIIDLHMDEGSGLIAYDATGNHDGEFRGGMTTDDWMSYDGGFWDRRTDLVFNGSCIEFDGTYNRVDCGDGSDIPKSGSFTVCCWAKPDVAGNKWAAITDSYDSNAHVTLPIYTTNVNTFSFTTASGSWTDLHTAGFSADIWYFIAATWDVSTHTKRVYLNGLINGTQTPQPSGYPYGSCTNFTVGGRRNGDEGVAFDGWVDEVKVYNRTLSGDEVWRMYIRSKYAANAPTAALGAEENASNFYIFYKPDLRVINVTFNHWDTSENISSISETGAGCHVKGNRNITINATIANYADINVTSNFNVSFFDSAGVYGNWSRCFWNFTYNVSTEGELGSVTTGYPHNTTYVTGYWNPSLVGTHNISVWANPANSASESAKNTTDNNASAVINVSAWQKYYGNVSGSIALADSASNLLYNWTWSNKTDVGYAYIVNAGASINWSALHALGCDSDNTLNASGQDFLDADTNLGMVVGSNNATGFLNNNITELFSSGDPGNATNTTSFTVYGTGIPNVPIINSIMMTNHTSIETANFVTGILWDATSDKNGYYDTTDDETLVFVTKITVAAKGFGSNEHNYEFAAPCTLNPVVGGDMDIYMELK
jgi:lysophospholipase L1-like esterase